MCAPRFKSPILRALMRVCECLGWLLYGSRQRSIANFLTLFWQLVSGLTNDVVSLQSSFVRPHHVSYLSPVSIPGYSAGGRFLDFRDTDGEQDPLDLDIDPTLLTLGLGLVVSRIWSSRGCFGGVGKNKIIGSGIGSLVEPHALR